jgi:hypothetical protein
MRARLSELSGTSAYYWMAAFGTPDVGGRLALAALGAVGAGPTLLAAAKVNGLKVDDSSHPGLRPRCRPTPADFGPVDTWTPGVDEEPAV